MNTMAISRRGMCAFLYPAAMGAPAPAMDGDWDYRFRAFIKQLNLFVMDMNDGVIDQKRWKRVREAWKILETK